MKNKNLNFFHNFLFFIFYKMETRRQQQKDNSELAKLLQNDFDLYLNYLAVYNNIDVSAYHMLINRHEFRPSHEALTIFKNYLNDNNLKAEAVASENFKFNKYLTILKKEVQKTAKPRKYKKLIFD